MARPCSACGNIARASAARDADDHARQSESAAFHATVSKPLAAPATAGKATLAPKTSLARPCSACGNIARASAARDADDHARQSESAAFHATVSKPLAAPATAGKATLAPKTSLVRNGLNFIAWSADQVSTVFIHAAQLTAAEIDTVRIRIRRDLNLVVASTPEPEVAVRVQELPAITINGRQYEILAYIALPDNSCRGVITGLDSRPTSEILSTRIRAQGVNVLCARMMGQTNTAIINFEGLKVPYYVYFRVAEYRCLPHRPGEQICNACLGLGHRVMFAPIPRRTKAAVSQPRTNSLVIVGDFNAAHLTWGYVQNPTGRRLAQAIANNHLAIMTEPEQPTRMGNSDCRDTCPDQTLVGTQTSCSWSNLDETLRSDLSILETEVCDGGRRTRKLRPARLMNWDQVRQQTWAILRSLLDPSRFKTETSEAVTKLLHRLQREEPLITKELESRYLATGQRPDYAEYSYTEEPTQLDADFTESEIQAILAKLMGTTIPGKDGLTNKMLHNLDDASITALTQYFNEVWRTGSIPEEWKHADITLIPKPGKPLGLQNLRPISLTSCGGKLMENVVLSRPQPYLE
ncbi:hypothetical protein HPB47_000965 [Ixodes persulcatus]|uniref:Uncharacterized protein n=1 Tax=Ixodes persulcatus TaxID=34615 RepID=A0AC60PQE9_IXOPE|nr:hypothetical protein HPB47_000965 [Ixodes persulcatus]